MNDFPLFRSCCKKTNSRRYLISWWSSVFLFCVDRYQPHHKSRIDYTQIGWDSEDRTSIENSCDELVFRNEMQFLKTRDVAKENIGIREKKSLLHSLRSLVSWWKKIRSYERWVFQRWVVELTTLVQHRNGDKKNHQSAPRRRLRFRRDPRLTLN